MAQDRALSLALQPRPVATVKRSLAAVLSAAVLGLFLLYGTGFAYPSLLHNAAHDARHAFAFPCH
ncbi:MAG: CbtB-domain containing protein [Proteobacteria bacterium]|nr:CbtB-domain containing protein [Pseudomonadota bacterium]MBI3498454.1 CbtB-domain containing protein [Pseudomonadota bacterium]